MSGCKTLNDVIAGTHEWEIDLENLGKRKAEQVQTMGAQAKRPKIQDQWVRGQ